MTVERALRLIAGARGSQCAAGHLCEREFPVVHAVRGREPLPVRVYKLVSDDGHSAEGRPARRRWPGDASQRYVITRSCRARTRKPRAHVYGRFPQPQPPPPVRRLHGGFHRHDPNERLRRLECKILLAWGDLGEPACPRSEQLLQTDCSRDEPRIEQCGCVEHQESQ